MGKAIIIIDMPDNCTKCTFIHRDWVNIGYIIKKQRNND